MANGRVAAFGVVTSTTGKPGTWLRTDGWSAYHKACRDWFTHEPHLVSASGLQANELLPAVHRGASLCKRWLLGAPFDHLGLVVSRNYPTVHEDGAL